MKEQNDTSEFANATALARILGYSGPKGSRRVTAAAERREIPGRRINGRWRFHVPTVLSLFSTPAPRGRR
ncbi:MAG: hypothetical protein DVB31_13110 [Verrucomicrobia bacterium]|nr:MAG: hypothetical protein DVB31_13110 [Verrucomicrobiota bacterium]